MPTRRQLLIIAGIAAAFATVMPRVVFAQDSAAAAFVQKNGQRILSLAPSAQNDSSSRAQLLDVVNQSLDVDGIARFALGPYTRRATPAQLQHYLQLFHQVISNGVTARLSTYQGASFTLGRSEGRGDDTLVDTTITRAGSPPANVNWLVGTVGGQMKILDVIAEGTSLRQTERSDYTSYLQSHGGNIDALLSAIEAQQSH
jgi:phospholipid transport system substrate-binding protein